ncbi:TerD family protein [Streptomyces sp. NPDC002476]|uniref:TerD family protein n=1 Tax=Streptomyces sp. NPDC002476 TaxID=3364648 RepID=UPI0036755F3B
MSTISMTKGSAPARLAKSPSIRVRCWWDSRTDYDLYSLVVYADGRVETVATFSAEGVPAQLSTADGAVKHLGDVGRQTVGVAEEIIEITLDDSIRAVVPVAYSAQSNGRGSFFEYHVSMELDNGIGDRVVVTAENANANRRIYSCVPGMLENTADGVSVHALEHYSEPGSENRPLVRLARRGLMKKSEVVTVEMDAGPRNAFK